MDHQEEKKKESPEISRWGLLCAAFTIAAWAASATWEGPFDFLRFAGYVLAAAFFAVLAIVSGYVIGTMAEQKKGWERFEYILIGIGLNAFLIYACFFR